FPIHWHHFGNGELEETLKVQAAEQLSDRPALQYTFHGYVQNTQLPQLYQQIGAQLFITTSETEGLPVSMMEAYAMGMPVIATAVGGIPEMVQEGKNGFLMPNHPDDEQVALAILRYAALPQEEKQQMSQCALASWQEHFDAAANAEKLLPLLAQQ
ncbi:MAG: glycosyltransferase, partial [Clostridia bacterium]|nr:glycosyltransferase [Clostridia bacterium]